MYKNINLYTTNIRLIEPELISETETLLCKADISTSKAVIATGWVGEGYRHMKKFNRQPKKAFAQFL